MSEYFYADYIWRKGRPLPLKKANKEEESTYRILSDSYQKKIVIEKYLHGKFDRTVYDSSLLDFKTVKGSEGKELWYKESLSSTSALIRDECDRVVALEDYKYQSDRLIETKVYSPHAIQIATQVFSYPQDEEVIMEFLDVEGKSVYKEKLKQALPT